MRRSVQHTRIATSLPPISTSNTFSALASSGQHDQGPARLSASTPPRPYTNDQDPEFIRPSLPSVKHVKLFRPTAPSSVERPRPPVYLPVRPYPPSVQRDQGPLRLLRPAPSLSVQRRRTPVRLNHTPLPCTSSNVREMLSIRPCTEPLRLTFLLSIHSTDFPSLNAGHQLLHLPPCMCACVATQNHSRGIAVVCHRN